MGFDRFTRRVLRRGAREPTGLLEERLATARLFAGKLTEHGTRCDRNDGRTRYCYWQATELGEEVDGAPAVGVRCTIHPGGRCLDSSQRLHWSELTEP